MDESTIKMNLIRMYDKATEDMRLSRMKERWKDYARIYSGEIEDPAPEDKTRSKITVNTIIGDVNTANAHTQNILFGQKPWRKAIPAENKFARMRAKICTEALQYFYENFGYKDAVEETLLGAFVYGNYYIKVTPAWIKAPVTTYMEAATYGFNEENEFVMRGLGEYEGEEAETEVFGLRFTAIHPGDFFREDSNEPLNSCGFCGHRAILPLDTVRIMAENGDWNYKHNLKDIKEGVKTTTPEDEESAFGLRSYTSQRVEVREYYIREVQKNGSVKYKIAALANGNVLLRYENSPFRGFYPYVDFDYLRIPGRKRAIGMVQLGCEEDRAITAMIRQMIDLTTANIFPMTYMARGAMISRKSMERKLGATHEVDNPAQDIRTERPHSMSTDTYNMIGLLQQLKQDKTGIYEVAKGTATATQAETWRGLSLLKRTSNEIFNRFIMSFAEKLKILDTIVIDYIRRYCPMDLLYAVSEADENSVESFMTATPKQLFADVDFEPASSAFGQNPMQKAAIIAGLIDRAMRVYGLPVDVIEAWRLEAEIIGVTEVLEVLKEPEEMPTGLKQPTGDMMGQRGKPAPMPTETERPEENVVRMAQ